MNEKIGVVGLGYVGLPLAVEFSKVFPVVGFDIKQKRIFDLKGGFDETLEVSEEDLSKVSVKVINSKKGLFFSSELKDLSLCNYYIVTVPTPVDKFNKPDLTLLYKSSEAVGKVLKRGDIVIYESTVYPGVTEEECVPVLEKTSGLVVNKDFYVGYSPERINPGDKIHTVTNILKVTSGSTPETADKVDSLYRTIIKAGTHKATSIRVAEAAKVIENSQRDINIAYVNELAKIFNRLGIDTHEVLEAAGTKWNFLKFSPGLVGGHCIGVDPYYLAQKAQEVGYHPEIILAGRRLNDGMGSYVAGEVVKLMLKRDIAIKNGRVLILGFTFKENCPDVRNTRVIDIYKEMQEYDLQVDVFDPHASSEEVAHEYGIQLKTGESNLIKYSAIILAVAHDYFKNLDISSLREQSSIIYDVKGFFSKENVDGRL